MINGELIYIATVFGLFCYMTDVHTIYKMHKDLSKIETINEHQSVNNFSLKVRICILISNGCMLSFNVVNNISTPIISYTFFYILDFSLLITRIYYTFLIRNIIKNQSQKIPNMIINPIIDQSVSSVTEIDSV